MPNTQTGMRQPLRVMIVDDEPTFQELVRVMLSMDTRFHTVWTAASGEEALQELPRVKPDLVLLDFRMGGGIDGLETAKRMKVQHPDVRVILVTAHAAEVLGRLAKAAQVEGIISKSSFSIEQVCTLLGWSP